MLNEENVMATAAFYAALKKGEEWAFSTIYVRYRHWLMMTACGILKDEQEAADIVQKYFVEAWSNGKLEQADICHEKALRTYLVHCIRNLCFSRLARLSRRQEVYNMVGNVYMVRPLCVETNMMYRDKFSHLLRFLDELSPQVKKIAKMHFLEEKSQSEIADELTLSYNTVRNHLHCARNQLKLSFEKIY